MNILKRNTSLYLLTLSIISSSSIIAMEQPDTNEQIFVQSIHEKASELYNREHDAYEKLLATHNKNVALVQKTLASHNKKVISYDKNIVDLNLKISAHNERVAALHERLVQLEDDKRASYNSNGTCTSTHLINTLDAVLSIAIDKANEDGDVLSRQKDKLAQIKAEIDKESLTLAKNVSAIFGNREDLVKRHNNLKALREKLYPQATSSQTLGEPNSLHPS